MGETKGIIKSEKALDYLADKLGIEADDKYEKCIKVANVVLSDLYKPRFVNVNP